MLYGDGGTKTMRLILDVSDVPLATLNNFCVTYGYDLDIESDRNCYITLFEKTKKEGSRWSKNT